MNFTSSLSEFFSKRVLLFIAFQGLILLGIVWFIAGNDRLFRSAVPIEQRLVSHKELIRKKAQQELLGLDPERKRQVAGRLVPALEQEEAFVRKWAAISLALIGPSAQEAIPALLQSVSAKEKDVAQASRVALSEIGAPDAQQLPSLVHALEDSRTSVRCEAALSIGKMGPAAQGAVPQLITLINRKEGSPSCFEEALASLSAGVPEVYPPVIALLANANVNLRRKAAHILAIAGARTPTMIQALFEILGHEPDAQTRAGLANALQLSTTPEPDRAAVLAVALHTEYLPVRLEAARAVRANAPRGRSALPLIVRMLRDEDPAIRRLGLETLRRSGLMSPDLLQKVARAQRDSDSGVRCRAVETLIESGEADRVSISLLIGDLRRDEDTARCAEDVLGLAGLFDNDVMHSMIHLVLEEKDPDIRSRAAHVLMHLGSRAREAIPALQLAQKDHIPGAEMALKAVRAPATKNRR